MLVQSPVSQPQMVPVSHLSSSNTPEATHISPRDMEWDNQRCYSADSMDIVTWNYYTLPPSPPASVSSNTDESPEFDTKMIRPRFTSGSPSEIEQQRCLPTSQVFDFEGMEQPSSSSSESPPPSIPHQLTLSSDNGSAVKKPFSTIGGVKKGRGTGERITTKDFVPPDVTGLSKREARLLKNRAACLPQSAAKKRGVRGNGNVISFHVDCFHLLMVFPEAASRSSKKKMRDFKPWQKKERDTIVSSRTWSSFGLRLSVAEKRERDLTVELANRTAANLAMKTESQDFNLSPTSYSPYVGAGQASIISIMVRELVACDMKQGFNRHYRNNHSYRRFQSLLALPQHTSLPITFSIPLTGSSSARPSSSTYGHSPSPCDIKDQGRPRYGHGSVGFQPSSADIESSRKMAIGGDAAEGRPFDMDGLHSLGSLSISFDALSTEDGRDCVRVHVSERNTKAGIHGSRQTPSSLTWSGADPSLTIPCYASPPLSTPINIPSPGGIDHLVFAGTGGTHSRMSFDTQLMTSGYPPFTPHETEKTFDYYPGLVLE
ncbi:hypothetical protein JVU11DRAFT_7397 [Chiua virens]|nr:hypothetical protein JVU11DRAFT_7397 [Chiua virens]